MVTTLIKRLLGNLFDRLRGKCSSYLLLYLGHGKQCLSKDVVEIILGRIFYFGFQKIEYDDVNTYHGISIPQSYSLVVLIFTPIRLDIEETLQKILKIS